MKDYSVLDDLVDDTTTLHRKIFDKGFEQGFKKVVESYNAGLEDAWNIAKRIAVGYSNSELYEMFGEKFNSTRASIFMPYTIHEVREKIEAWEKKQKEQDNEIRVGDEVYLGNEIGIVVKKHSKIENTFTLLFGDGFTTKTYGQNLKKTGRSFASDLSNLLSRIGEDEND